MKNFNYKKREYLENLQKYFSKYELHKKSGYLQVYTEEINERFNSKYEEYIKDKEELLQWKKIDSYIRIHLIKYILWRLEFCKDDYDEVAIDTAIGFNIFCCIGDDILDEGSDCISRDSAIDRITWENVNKYFGDIYYIEDKDILDCFYKIISKGFYTLKGIDNNLFNEIIDNVKLSLESEIYVSSNFLDMQEKKIDLDVLVNKSTKFVKACLQIAAIGTKEKVRMNKCAEYVAKIFWLVDDLCDLYDDIETRTKNSIIYKYIPSVDSIEEAIDEVITYQEEYVKEIFECLNGLKNSVRRELYDYLYFHILSWCDCVEQKIKEIDEC